MITQKIKFIIVEQHDYINLKCLHRCRHKGHTSYGALLVLTASFSLKIGIPLRDNNDCTVSESCLLKSGSLKSLSVTRSWEEVTSSCIKNNVISAIKKCATKRRTVTIKI